MMKSAAILVTILGLICSVSAHGRFSSPPYRGLFQKDWYTYMDNAPTKDSAGGNSANIPEFVCRKNNVMPTANWTTITAGAVLNIQMTFEAAHVGDCFLYLTYDADKAETDMKWFKIWQQHECKDNNQVNVPVTIPDYLPSTAHAILRWEWYALHVYPEVEFYAQCADVKVNGIANGVLGTPMVSIPGNLPPAKAADGTPNYRDPFNQHDGKMQDFFTGPPVATAGGSYTPGTPAPSPTSGTPAPSSSGTPAPSSSPSRSPSTTSPSPSSTPSQSPTPTPPSTGNDKLITSSASVSVVALLSVVAMLFVVILL